jgi:hypothetical protein
MFPQTLNDWIKGFFGLTILTIPFQVHVLVYQTLWGRGFLNPYTSIWFSLSEFLLLITAILFFYKILKSKKKIKVGHPSIFLVFLTIIGVLALSIAISPFQDPSFHFLLYTKFLELIILYLLIVNQVMKPRNILEIFVVTMSFQALIAIFQVIFQSSLGLGFLGEVQLSGEAAHIARFTIQDLTIIRGYGTFPHPNVLGGHLVISLLCSLLYTQHLKNERIPLIILQFFGLLVTFSRSAMTGLVLATVIIALWHLQEIKKNKKVPIAISVVLLLEFIILGFTRGLNIFTDPAFIERLEGYKLALNIFLEHPLGVGFNHMTLFLDEVSTVPLMPWEYQPVHNILLLALTEAGVIGFLVAIGIIQYVIRRLLSKRRILLTRAQRFKKRILLVVLLTFFTISLFDHYLVSLDQGRFVLVMIFAIVSSFSHDPRHVLPIKKGGDLSKILSDQ